MKDKMWKTIHTIKRMPLCHKCSHGLWANDLNIPLAGGKFAQAFKGCNQNAQITTSADTEALCPILPKS